jgi:hypothetical protein
MEDEVFPSLEGWIRNPFSEHFHRQWKVLSEEQKMLCVRASIIRLKDIITEVLRPFSILVGGQAIDNLLDPNIMFLNDTLASQLKELAKPRPNCDETLIDPIRYVANMFLYGAFGETTDDDYYPAAAGGSVCQSIEWLALQEGLLSETCRQPNSHVPGLFSSFESECNMQTIWLVQSHPRDELSLEMMPWLRSSRDVFRPLLRDLTRVWDQREGDLLQILGQPMT